LHAGLCVKLKLITIVAVVGWAAMPNMIMYRFYAKRMQPVFLTVSSSQNVGCALRLLTTVRITPHAII